MKFSLEITTTTTNKYNHDIVDGTFVVNSTMTGKPIEARIETMIRALFPDRYGINGSHVDEVWFDEGVTEADYKGGFSVTLSGND